MPDPQGDPDWPRIRRLASLALCVGVVLCAAKFFAFWLTDSAAILSDAAESVINVVAAAVMLYTLWLANRPPDDEHPYGHGKAEFMAAAFEGALILLAGVLIAFEGARRLFDPPDLQRLGVGMVIIAVAGGVNAALAVVLLRAGKRHDSAALTADARHLLTDVWTTLAVVGGLLLVRVTGLQWLDPLLAIGFACFIVFTGWRLVGDSLSELMDRADPDDERAVLDILDEEIARGAILGHHKVRVRRSGAFRWVDMHLQVDGSMDVARAHDIASRIEGRIERAFGRANATAHVEPAEQHADRARITGALGAHDAEAADADDPDVRPG